MAGNLREAAHYRHQVEQVFEMIGFDYRSEHDRIFMGDIIISFYTPAMIEKVMAMGRINKHKFVGTVLENKDFDKIEKEVLFRNI